MYHLNSSFLISEKQFSDIRKINQNYKIMRLTKDEKEKLFELLDVMTDRCPSVRLDMLLGDAYLRAYWSMFKKLRVEVRGY